MVCRAVARPDEGPVLVLMERAAPATDPDVTSFFFHHLMLKAQRRLESREILQPEQVNRT
jgi:hypothetical protein